MDERAHTKEKERKDGSEEPGPDLLQSPLHCLQQFSLREALRPVTIAKVGKSGSRIFIRVTAPKINLGYYLKYEIIEMANLHEPITSEVSEGSRQLIMMFNFNSSLGLHLKLFPAMGECFLFTFFHQLCESLFEKVCKKARPSSGVAFLHHRFHLK